MDVRQELLRGARGAVAGGVATVPMSAWMAGVKAVAGRRAHGEQPPRRITRTAAEAADLPAEEHPRATDAATLVLHLGTGAGLGTVLALLDRRPAAWRGALFGVAVYSVAYGGVVPALRIMPPPTDDRPARQWSIATAHVVFGATAGAVLGRLTPRGRRHRLQAG